jgi:hypothetical protein
MRRDHVASVIVNANDSMMCAAAKTGKKNMVWVPSSTGSHIGGRWVEVPDGAAEPGALNVKRANAEQLQREAHSMGNPNTGP